MLPVIDAERAAELETKNTAFRAWLGSRCSYREEEVPLDVRMNNDERSRLEVYRVVTDKPEKLFVYVKFSGDATGQVTTWTGEHLGTFTSVGRAYRDSFGGTRQRIRVTLRGGAGEYHGTYYKSSGDYAHLTRCKKQEG